MTGVTRDGSAVAASRGGGGSLLGWRSQQAQLKSKDAPPAPASMCCPPPLSPPDAGTFFYLACSLTTCWGPHAPVLMRDSGLLSQGIKTWKSWKKHQASLVFRWSLFKWGWLIVASDFCISTLCGGQDSRFFQEIPGKEILCVSFKKLRPEKHRNRTGEACPTSHIVRKRCNDYIWLTLE